jgi:hypothetical protein
MNVLLFGWEGLRGTNLLKSGAELGTCSEHLNYFGVGLYCKDLDLQGPRTPRSGTVFPLFCSLCFARNSSSHTNPSDPRSALAHPVILETLLELFLPRSQNRMDVRTYHFKAPSVRPHNDLIVCHLESPVSTTQVSPRANFARVPTHPDLESVLAVDALQDVAELCKALHPAGREPLLDPAVGDGGPRVRALESVVFSILLGRHARKGEFGWARYLGGKEGGNLNGMGFVSGWSLEPGRDRGSSVFGIPRMGESMWQGRSEMRTRMTLTSMPACAEVAIRDIWRPEAYNGGALDHQRIQDHRVALFLQSRYYRIDFHSPRISTRRLRDDENGRENSGSKGS